MTHLLQSQLSRNTLLPPEVCRYNKTVIRDRILVLEKQEMAISQRFLDLYCHQMSSLRAYFVSHSLKSLSYTAHTVGL